MRTSLDIVRVRWVDTETSVGWDTDEDSLSPFELNVSVGFFVSQDESKYVIAGDYDFESSHFNRFLRIPKSVIRDIKVLQSISVRSA